MNVISLKENVNLHIYKTDKFKDVNVFIEFLDNSDKHDQVLRNLLSSILEDTCSLYNTKQSVSNLFNKLYGGSFGVLFDVKGSARLMEVKCSLVNGKYVGDSSLLENQFRVINEFLLRPIWIDKEYPNSQFLEIKDRLKQEIIVSNDRPSTYSNNKADLLYGEYIGVKADLDVDLLDDISIEDVKELYDKIIDESSVDIIVIGDVDEKEVKKLCNQYLYFDKRQSQKDIVYKSLRDNYVEKIEKKKINQTLLQLRYKTNKTVLDSDFPSMIIANGILGTLPTSLLFQEVREKRSLCYSISSVIYGYDGIMKISTGIDFKNIEEVKELITLQINRIKIGDFEDSLLETTKKVYVNLYRSSSDNVKMLMWDEYINSVIPDGITMEEMIEKIKTVSKESIIDAFKDVEIMACYTLKQMENSNEQD